MALREATVPVRFSGGVDTKSNPKTVPSTRLLALENGVFTEALSIRKRFGYDALGSSVLGSATGYTDVRGLGARGDELILFAEGKGYSYVEGASAWDEIPDGVMSVRQSDAAIVKTISNQTACDYARSNDVAMVAWEDSRGGVYYAVQEADGGRITIPATQASSTGSRPRCVRSGDNLILVWAEAALGQLKVIVVDPTAPHLAGSATVLTDDVVTTHAVFDAAYVPDLSIPTESAAALAWNATSGIRVAWLMPSGAIGSVGSGYPGALTITTTATVTAGPVIAVNDKGFSASLWHIGWATATKTYYDDPFSSISDPSDPIAHTGAVEIDVAGVDRLALSTRRVNSGDVVEMWLEERAATVRNSYVTRVSIVGGAPVTRQTIRGVTLGSAAWTDRRVTLDDPDTFESHVFVNLLHPLPLQSTYLAVREDGLVVAQSIPTNGPASPPGHQLPRVTDEYDRIYRWCGVYRGKIDALEQGVFTESGPRLITLDFGADDAYQSVTVGRTLYLGGAVTMAYDGVSFVEAWFHYAPDWESGAVLHTFSTAGTGGMGNGVYNYIAWYEATLANGEIIRGPVSKPYRVTVAGSDDRVSLTIPTCRVTAWGRNGGSRENCRVCVARTINGDSAFYYRVTSLDPSTAGNPNGYVANDPTADAVTVIDELSDANLQLQEPNYTTGGVPSNDAIATAGIIAEGKGRLFVASASDPNVVYVSQQRAEGFAIEFTPEVLIQVPPSGGAVTAIASVDQAVVIFERNAIYAVGGDGPQADPAAGGGFSLPGLVTSDVGCVDQRSVAVVPDGLMFKSTKGIYKLDRGLGSSYVGAPVEDFNSLTISTATLIESTNQVRFLTDGVCLVYDYLFGQWSTFTNHAGLGARTVAGSYHYLRTDGRVFKESRTSYFDDNQQIRLRLDTAWLHMQETLQGLQHLWSLLVLGDRESAHELRVSLQVDFEDQWLGPFSLDSATPGGTTYGEGLYGSGVYSGTPAGAYQWRIHLGLICEAIKFRFEDYESVGAAGGSFVLTELLLTGGVKSNAMRPFAAARST